MQLDLILDGFTQPPELDTAISRAILEDVAAGRRPATFRLYRPANVVAFGRQDTRHPGYADARIATHRAGFAAVERLAGGRAAVFHDGTLAFSWASPITDPRRGVTDRFEWLTSALVASLRSLGLDARVGEVPGEYCPGRHSINLGGARKVIGVGQRIIRGAAHVGGVIVVAGAERINAVLDPVYAALGLSFSPSATGDISMAAALEVDEVLQATVAELDRRTKLRTTSLDRDFVTDVARTLGQPPA